MRYSSQWGDIAMSVKFDRAVGCYTWTCIFGHYGFDYEGEQEAINAFLGHPCQVQP